MAAGLLANRIPKPMKLKYRADVISELEMGLLGRSLHKPEPQPTPWYHLVLPWEEPGWLKGKRKWRRRHERIARLEYQLFKIHFPNFPWERFDW